MFSSFSGVNHRIRYCPASPGTTNAVVGTPRSNAIACILSVDRNPSGRLITPAGLPAYCSSANVSTIHACMLQPLHRCAFARLNYRRRFAQCLEHAVDRASHSPNFGVAGPAADTLVDVLLAGISRDHPIRRSWIAMVRIVIG